MPSHRRSRHAPPTPLRAGEVGQAALEYAAVLALVAGVLVLGGVLVGAAGWGNGVRRGFERALCRVTGADCLATELAACTVRSRETGGRLGVQLTFVKLGGSLSLLREELSDGTVDITLVDGADIAPTAGLGAAGGVRLGGRRIGAAAITKAELLVRLGRRRVWHRPDAASADRLVGDIAEHVAVGAAEHALPLVGTSVRKLAHAVGYDGDELPRPDITALSAGAEGLVEAELGDLAQVSAGMKASLGGTWDRGTGRRTFVFALDGDAGGTLAKAVGGGALEGAMGASLSVVLDRAGAPLELGVATTGSGRGDLHLGLRAHKATSGSTDRVEVTSQLDLGMPANRAVFDELLGALVPGRQRALPGAVSALVRQLGTSARRDVVRYATDVKAYGADGEVAAGARAGVAGELTRTSLTLRDAWTRPAGGMWQPRTDCVAARA